jgi:hypothetical protein
MHSRPSRSNRGVAEKWQLTLPGHCSGWREAVATVCTQTLSLSRSTRSLSDPVADNGRILSLQHWEKHLVGNGALPLSGDAAVCIRQGRHGLATACLVTPARGVALMRCDQGCLICIVKMSESRFCTRLVWPQKRRPKF